MIATCVSIESAVEYERTSTSSPDIWFDCSNFTAAVAW